MPFANILIVDDEATIRDRLEEIIEEFGHNPITAEDGATARARLCEQSPDLVITDLNLPDTTGIELLREIRGMDQQIPVAIITGYASVNTAVQAIQDGAYDYLAKPFKMMELEKVINKGLKLRKGLKDPALIAPYFSQQVDFKIPSSAGLLEGVMTMVTSTLEHSGVCSANIIKDLCLCLEESLVNAIFHGNSLNEAKFTTISIQLAHTGIRMSVEDEGDGFDHSPFAKDKDLGELMNRGGHGLFLILCLMDEVEFNEKGNAITMVKQFASIDPGATVN